MSTSVLESRRKSRTVPNIRAPSEHPRSKRRPVSPGDDDALRSFDLGEFPGRMGRFWRDRRSTSSSRSTLPPQANRWVWARILGHVPRPGHLSDGCAAMAT